jgi:hypothetical protein
VIYSHIFYLRLFSEFIGERKQEKKKHEQLGLGWRLGANPRQGGSAYRDGRLHSVSQPPS